MAFKSRLHGLLAGDFEQARGHDSDSHRVAVRSKGVT